MTVLIKHKQAKINKVENMLNKYCQRDNLIWEGKYSIQIHALVAMWKIKKNIEKKMQYKH